MEQMLLEHCASGMSGSRYASRDMQTKWSLRQSNWLLTGPRPPQRQCANARPSRCPSQATAWLRFEVPNQARGERAGRESQKERDVPTLPPFPHHG